MFLDTPFPNMIKISWLVQLQLVPALASKEDSVSQKWFVSFWALVSGMDLVTVDGRGEKTPSNISGYWTFGYFQEVQVNYLSYLKITSGCTQHIDSSKTKPHMS